MEISWAALLFGALVGALVCYFRVMGSPAHGSATNPFATPGSGPVSGQL